MPRYCDRTDTEACSRRRDQRGQPICGMDRRLRCAQARIQPCRLLRAATAGLVPHGAQEPHTMSNTIRNDAIALNVGVDSDAFERFMTSELMPHFAERFKGPTRTSKADLKALSLLRDAKSARRFLLVTTWDGAAASVAGGAFENARMNSVARTDALLKKLDGFAKRSAEKVYAEVVRIAVPTNV
jgi:hypothetical protein